MSVGPSDGPQHDPGETQPVQPTEGTRPMPSNPWQVPPHQERDPNGEYGVGQPAQPPAPPHYPAGQYPATPYPPQSYPGQTPGQAPGQAPGQGYGYPVYGQAADSPRGQAIGALVVNLVLVVLTCFAALPSIAGAIVSGIAIGTADSDPAQARTLVKWGWGLAITTVVLGVLLIALVATFAIASDGT